MTPCCHLASIHATPIVSLTRICMCPSAQIAVDVKKQLGKREASSFTHWFSNFAEGGRASGPASTAASSSVPAGRLRLGSGSGGGGGRLLLPMMGSVLEEDGVSGWKSLGGSQYLPAFDDRQLQPSSPPRPALRWLLPNGRPLSPRMCSG